MIYDRSRSVACAALACLAVTVFLTASGEPRLDEEQIKQFLRTAKVISSKRTEIGITHPWRLTLTDGQLTHDASFQPIDERKASMQFASGRTETGFVDSWKYNIAAYELAKLVGLGDMMPVYVERKWNGMTGSLSWWLPVKMDERERIKQRLQPPDPEAWDRQVKRRQVFLQLVYDSDPNLTNLLIGEDWKLWMIDFSRAFRFHYNLPNPENLVRCDRQLLEKLRQLDESEVEGKTQPYLSREEIRAVMARRDKIVAYFEKLIAEKGEGQVLY